MTRKMKPRTHLRSQWRKVFDWGKWTTTQRESLSINHLIEIISLIRHPRNLIIQSLRSKIRTSWFSKKVKPQMKSQKILAGTAVWRILKKLTMMMVMRLCSISISKQAKTCNWIHFSFSDFSTKTIPVKGSDSPRDLINKHCKNDEKLNYKRFIRD